MATHRRQQGEAPINCCAGRHCNLIAGYRVAAEDSAAWLVEGGYTIPVIGDEFASSIDFHRARTNYQEAADSLHDLLAPPYYFGSGHLATFAFRLSPYASNMNWRLSDPVMQRAQDGIDSLDDEAIVSAIATNSNYNSNSIGF